MYNYENIHIFVTKKKNIFIDSFVHLNSNM